MPGHAGALASGLVFINIVPAVVAVQRAIVSFEVLDEFPALHSLGYFQLFLGNNRRITGKVVGAHVFQV